MGKIVAGLASSHAGTFAAPETWDARRARNRAMYQRRYGVEPPQPPQLEAETLDVIQPRYARVQAGLGHLRAELAARRPDALIVIGDDQNENFTEENMPQLAIYTGPRLRAVGHDQGGREYPCHAELAEALLANCVDQGFDVAYSRQFPNDELRSHAHGPPLAVLTPEADLPIVPIFINAIHVPAPAPARCYAFGQALRRAIEARPPDERVAIYASGGLSHFTAGYPWRHYSGPYNYGTFSVDFDRHVLECLERGEGSRLASLTSQDLLDNGEIELRSWIVLLGALGDRPASELVYEPFYRANMAMGVAYWELEASQSGAHAA